MCDAVKDCCEGFASLLTLHVQVRALAAVYGLEPRACGRTGQTLFRTERTGALTNKGLAQVSHTCFSSLLTHDTLHHSCLRASKARLRLASAGPTTPRGLILADL